MGLTNYPCLLPVTPHSLRIWKLKLEWELNKGPMLKFILEFSILGFNIFKSWMLLLFLSKAHWFDKSRDVTISFGTSASASFYISRNPSQTWCFLPKPVLSVSGDADRRSERWSLHSPASLVLLPLSQHMRPPQRRAIMETLHSVIPGVICTLNQNTFRYGWSSRWSL